MKLSYRLFRPVRLAASFYNIHPVYVGRSKGVRMRLIKPAAPSQQTAAENSAYNSL
ncbi:hypothetical protein GCM10027089_27030 [Nocardia thraciensis]